MASISERFKSLVSWANTFWTILGWLGWKQLATSIFLAAAGLVGGWMQNVPVSIALMAAFCVFVAALYLTQIPGFIRATRELEPQDRPDPDIWRHVERLTLAQGACLLANVTPRGETDVPRGDAFGWFQALSDAVHSAEVPRIKSRVDDEYNTFDRVYEPHSGTLITRKSLQAFAAKRKLQRSVLND